jgi:hypothetical protein
MEPIIQKYERLRPSVKHGSLALFRGTGAMAHIIQNCDKSYWNHIGVVIEVNGALFIVDANANGVQADRLSWRVSKYEGGDIGFITPTISETTKNYYLSKLLQRSDKKWIKYDFWNGGKELANRKWNLNLKVNTSENRDICSDFVSNYAVDTGLVFKAEFDKLRVAFPQDYERYFNANNGILFK